MMLDNSKNGNLNHLLKLHAKKFFSASNENLTSNEDKNKPTHTEHIM